MPIVASFPFARAGTLSGCVRDGLVEFLRSWSNLEIYNIAVDPASLVKVDPPQFIQFLHKRHLNPDTVSAAPIRRKELFDE